MAFVKATKKQCKLRAGLMGVSGSGKTFSAYDTDGFDHRRISGIGADPRNIPFGSDDRGSASHRSIKRSCGGIYIFPCNSGDVRRKFFETD